MWQTATMVIPCKSLLEAEILGSSGDSPELNQIPQDWYDRVDGKASRNRGISLRTTTHVVTSEIVDSDQRLALLDDAESAALGFLNGKHGALLIGDMAISQFFRPVSERLVSPAEAERTAQVVALAAQFLSGQRGYKPLGLH
jgi:hypothetical protein